MLLLPFCEDQEVWSDDDCDDDPTPDGNTNETPAADVDANATDSTAVGKENVGGEAKGADTVGNGNMPHGSSVMLAQVGSPRTAAPALPLWPRTSLSLRPPQYPT